MSSTPVVPPSVPMPTWSSPQTFTAWSIWRTTSSALATLSPVEEGHEIDADEAAARGDEAKLGVGLVARQIDQGAAAGMVDRDRLARGAGGLEAGALAAVRQIDHDPRGVEPLDHLAAEGGKAAIAGRHRAVAETVGGIVGELDDAHAEIGEGLDAARIPAHHRRVLEAVDDADPALVAGRAGCRRRSAP